MNRSNAGPPVAIGILKRAGARLTERRARSEAADRLLGCVNAQAREPLLFMEFSVPDTVDGRFDLVAVHAFLALRRLKVADERAQAVAQTFCDRLFKTFDISLREMGVGDLSVAKKMHKMADAFYGRLKAYDAALADAAPDALAQALLRNVYRGADGSRADAARLARYVEAQAAALEDQPAADLADGTAAFLPVTAFRTSAHPPGGPDPEQADAEQTAH